jgi:hypothetical protein
VTIDLSAGVVASRGECAIEAVAQSPTTTASKISFIFIPLHMRRDAL